MVIGGINIVRKVNGCMDVRHGHTQTMEDLFTAYAPYIEGVVVYDGNIASTSNVASSGSRN